jgi:hypothetical protein
MTARESCGCIQRVNEALRERGHQLNTACLLDAETLTLDRSTTIIATVPRGKGIPRIKTTLTPTFCPFCGVRQVPVKPVRWSLAANGPEFPGELPGDFTGEQP